MLQARRGGGGGLLQDGYDARGAARKERLVLRPVYQRCRPLYVVYMCVCARARACVWMRTEYDLKAEDVRALRIHRQEAEYPPLLLLRCHCVATALSLR